MSARTDRINIVLQQVLPLVVAAVIVGLGYFWFLQPVIAGYVRVRAEALPLESRAKILEQTVARGRAFRAPDESESLKLFEERVSRTDRVTEVLELMTNAIAESATDRKLRNLAIGAGDEGKAAPAKLQADSAMVSDTVAIDPRWSLFPYKLTHTPVTLSFDASYGTIVGFLGKIRSLPTAIEVRSVTLTRGLPLMNMQMTFLVFQRGDRQAVSSQSILPGSGSAPGMPSDSQPGSPLVPRVTTPGGPGV